MLEMTNEEYHANLTHLSSSALKLLYKDTDKFYQQYVLGNWDNKRKSALEFGTAIHTAILEPHLFDSNVAIFNGKMRSGKIYNEFLLQNEKKTILTVSEKERLDALVTAYSNCNTATNLLKDCNFEYTIMTDLYDLPVKCRCDGINIEQGYIVDVKTTAYDSSTETFKTTVQDLCYDLSAELYRRIAEKQFGKDFDFYFIVLSKSDYLCRVFKTSKATFALGNEKIMSAIETYRQFKLTGEFKKDIMVVDEEVTEI